jgi:hypothetical protein
MKQWWSKLGRKKQIALGVAGTVVAATLLINAGCGNSDGSQGEEINGMTPADAVRKFKLAEIQKDGKTIKEIATPEEAKAEETLFPLDQGPQNNTPIPDDYRLTEYEADEDTYYFKHSRPRTGGVFSYYYKVIRTDQGWKVDQIDVNEFKVATEGIEPHPIKEDEE